MSSLTIGKTEGRWRALPRIAAKTAKLILTVAVTFLGLLVVTFLIGRVVPVDPVLAVVGDRASQSTYDAAFIALGLDKPLYEQFWIYLSQALSGDLGTSILTKKPIVEDIARVFPATLELAMATPIPVIASGGVSTLDDLSALKAAFASGKPHLVEIAIEAKR